SPPPWRCDRQWSRQTYCRRASPCHRDGYHQPSLTAGNVIGKGLDHTQGTHRVHIEYMGPGFVVDAPAIPALLMSTSMATSLSCLAAFRTLSASVTSIGTILSMPPESCAKRRSLLAASGLRHAANTHHPSAKY